MLFLQLQLSDEGDATEVTISNWHRIGISETTLLQRLINGISHLVDVEMNLAHGWTAEEAEAYIAEIHIDQACTHVDVDESEVTVLPPEGAVAVAIDTTGDGILDSVGFDTTGPLV
jgi:hypothetical protein